MNPIQTRCSARFALLGKLALAGLGIPLALTLSGCGGDTAKFTVDASQQIGRAALTQLGVEDPTSDDGRITTLKEAQGAYKSAVQSSGVNSPAAKAARENLVGAIAAVQFQSRDHFRALGYFLQPYQLENHRVAGNRLEAAANEALYYQRLWDAENVAAKNPDQARSLLNQIGCKTTAAPASRTDDLGRLEAFDVRRTNPYRLECDRITSMVTAAAQATRSSPSTSGQAPLTTPRNAQGFPVTDNAFDDVNRR